MPRAGLETLWKVMMEIGNMWMQMSPYGGRMSEISESETAFAHRAGTLYIVQYTAHWSEGSSEATKKYVELMRKFYADMAPYVSSKPREAFLNYRDLDIGSNNTDFEAAKKYGAKYFKGNFQRLAEESHVQATVICAKSQGLQIRIGSGGHGYEGLSYVSEVPFVVLDMFNLRSVTIDKTGSYGFPAGVYPTLGVGEHFSGGGYGNLMRKYGLAVDNIFDARLVDVNGTILNRESMGEDLFWAIRGGGGVFNIPRTLNRAATDTVYQWQQVAQKLREDLFVMIQVVNGSHEGVEKTIRVSFIGFFVGPTSRLIEIVSDNFPRLGLQACSPKIAEDELDGIHRLISRLS
ncbi:hypothetical protein CXB51_012516 [Gossypium anomalum]|uniref:Berberine/berberine-like domain-containing protein n=1 Tax=Gossypium anomalum TaxID=47600 RepID=A0A8J5YR34_9ROSI|nr:hypothetical protein CXB51_012516 [Gossypium anomalum]